MRSSIIASVLALAVSVSGMCAYNNNITLLLLLHLRV